MRVTTTALIIAGVVIATVVVVAVPELGVRDVCHHNAEERSVGESIGFKVRV